MNFDIQTMNELSILTLNGRFDAYAVPQVKQWLDENTAVKNIIVDMAAVNFVDSTALSTLVQGMKKTRQRNGDLVLTRLQQPVHIIFELTRLDKAFKIFADVETAQASFSEPKAIA